MPGDGATVTIDESQRQMILLALAQLALDRPGWTFTLLETADLFGGLDAQTMFKEFQRLNADRFRAKVEPL